MILYNFFTIRTLTPPSQDDWDIVLAEEKEAKQKRLLASKNADERADILRLRYQQSGNLEALQRFEEIEAKRKKAEENYEHETQMSLFKQQKTQNVPLSEFLILLRPYFWPNGGKNRLIVLLTWLLLILSKASNIIAPIYIGLTISELVDGNIPYGYIALYCGLQFGNVLFKQSQNTVYLRVKQEAFVQIAEYTFYHLHTLSHNWHLRKKMGIVLRAMDRGISSADSVVSYLFLYLLPSVAECLSVFIIFFLKFNMPSLSAVVFFFICLYTATTIQITIARKKYRRATNRHDNAFHDKANDSLTNFESVKFFCNEKHETERYVESVRVYQQHSITSQASLAALNTLQTLCIQCCLFFCLVLTGTRVYHGELDIGAFTAVNAYVVTLFAPLTFLGSIYDTILQSFVDMNNLAELLAEEPEIDDLPTAQPLHLDNPKEGATVEFKNVSFHYPTQNKEVGLQNISFKVPAGTTTAIVGTTGSGKSTIGRLLFRFYDVLEGSIEIDGQDIKNVTQKSLRANIGVVPQDTALFNDTLLYNIKYGKLDATMDQIEDACDKAQILDFILSLQNQWQTTAGERGLRLSGGEKQRIAIARALLKDPPVVLLDEATSALDTVKEREIQKSLQTLGKNRTTIVIAHRLSTIRNADQIIVLEFGRIIEKGTHDELLALNGKYYDLWMEQVTSTPAPATEELEDELNIDTSSMTTNLDTMHLDITPQPVTQSIISPSIEVPHMNVNQSTPLEVSLPLATKAGHGSFEPTTPVTDFPKSSSITEPIIATTTTTTNTMSEGDFTDIHNSPSFTQVPNHVDLSHTINTQQVEKQQDAKSNKTKRNNKKTK